jgi:TolA-binding protein
LYDFASMAYERKEYEMAANSFAQYLQRYPTGRQVPMALFRLGECYVSQNRVGEAEPYFTEVVTRYPSSEGAASSAYRLGAIRFNARKFEDSAKFFGMCEARSTIPQVKLAAAYNKSRAYQMLGDRKRMMTALRSVATVKADNPYRETALLNLATALLAEDRKTEALEMFQEVVAGATDRAVLSDALVKAAVIEAETGKPDDALNHFEQALRMPETSEPNRGVALVGTVQALYAKGDFNGVIDSYNRNSHVLPPGDLRPKMLLLVGNSHRQRKTYARAVEVYLMIQQYHAGSQQAFEAGYWKLYCFYQLEDRKLPEFAKDFLNKYAADHRDHPFTALARLILADGYFNQQRYAEAATAFNDLVFDKLPDKIRPDALFNKGWAEAESGKHQDAIGTLTKFIEDFPKHPFIPKAIARRGLSLREVRDLPKALADFNLVIKSHPKSDAVELAYLQKGLIHTELREVKEMIASFEALVAQFPDSPAAAQAWFGIGRGWFEQKQFDTAIPALKKCLSKDAKTYLDRASPIIVLCHYAKQDADGLSKAIDDYREANSKAVSPPEVLTFAGMKLHEKGEFMKSSRFLGYAVEAYGVENTPAAVWNVLGMAHLETKSWDAAVAAIDRYLALTQDSPAKAKGHLTKSRALAGLAKFTEAAHAAEEGLKIVKDGKIQAQLLIQEGDILSAEAESFEKAGQSEAALQKWSEAAGKYVVPSQMFVDPEITPEALHKAAIALEKTGQRDKARLLRSQLKERYPNYMAKP